VITKKVRNLIERMSILYGLAIQETSAERYYSTMLGWAIANKYEQDIAHFTIARDKATEKKGGFFREIGAIKHELTLELDYIDDEAVIRTSRKRG
jgi:hypothetical protein